MDPLTISLLMAIGGALWAAPKVDRGIQRAWDALGGAVGEGSRAGQFWRPKPRPPKTVVTRASDPAPGPRVVTTGPRGGPRWSRDRSSGTTQVTTGPVSGGGSRGPLGRPPRGPAVTTSGTTQRTTGDHPEPVLVTGSEDHSGTGPVTTQDRSSGTTPGTTWRTGPGTSVTDQPVHQRLTPWDVVSRRLDDRRAARRARDHEHLQAWREDRRREQDGSPVTDSDPTIEPVAPTVTPEPATELAPATPLVVPADWHVPHRDRLMGKTSGSADPTLPPSPPIERGPSCRRCWLPDAERDARSSGKCDCYCHVCGEHEDVCECGGVEDHETDDDPAVVPLPDHPSLRPSTTNPGTYEFVPDPSQEEPVMAAPTVDVPTTNIPAAEHVPQHMDSGDQLATSLGEIADQSLDQLAAAAAAHVESGEALGMTGVVTGPWADVEGLIRQAAQCIKDAAEKATTAAQNERTRLTPSVEALSDASDALQSHPNVGVVRGG